MSDKRKRNLRNNKTNANEKISPPKQENGGCKEKKQKLSSDCIKTNFICPICNSSYSSSLDINLHIDKCLLKHKNVPLPPPPSKSFKIIKAQNYMINTECIICFEE
jgi:hypothetical protein